MGKVNKVAYIIPGYPYKVRQKPYKQIAGFFKSQGIKPVLVSMPWKHTTLSGNLEQFMRHYWKFGGKRVYVFGHSIGAVIAFVASAKIRPKLAILCSLSPVFREDLPYLKRRWKKLMGKRRLNDLKSYSFNKIVKDLKRKVILVAGAKEESILLRRVKAAKRKIKNNDIHLIKGAHHDISQSEYLETLQKIISKI